MILEQCAEYDKKEQEKLKKLAEKRKETSKILKDQHDEFKQKHIEILQEEILEGQIIKRKAQEALLKEKKDEEAKRVKRVAATKEAFKLNDQMKELKLKEIEKEKEEDIKIAQYQVERQKVLDERELVSERC